MHRIFVYERSSDCLTLSFVNSDYVCDTARLLRPKNLPISRETFIRRFWKLYSNHWNTVHIMVILIAVRMVSVEFSILESWLSHRMLRRLPTFVVAVLLEPLTHALSVLYHTQSCTKFLETSSYVLQTICKQYSRKLQAWRQKVKSSGFWWSMVFIIFQYTLSILKSDLH